MRSARAHTHTGLQEFSEPAASCLPHTLANREHNTYTRSRRRYSYNRLPKSQHSYPFSFSPSFPFIGNPSLHHYHPSLLHHLKNIQIHSHLYMLHQAVSFSSYFARFLRFFCPNFSNSRISFNPIHPTYTNTNIATTINPTNIPHRFGSG